jgi:hypothetical protein
MKDSERRQRNARMAQRKAAGATFSELAREFGVARSTAQKAVADHIGLVSDAARARQPADLDVGRLFVDAIENHEWAIEMAQKIAGNADNDNARIGAVRTVAATSEGLVKLLHLAGLTPDADAVLVARALRKRMRRESKEQGERMLTGNGGAAS